MGQLRTLAGTEPSRQVIALGLACTLTAVVLDDLFGGGLGRFFDVGFVALCLLLATLIRAQDFFTVGVLPPLLMLGVFALLAIGDRAVLADSGDGFAQAVVTGLAHHAPALFVGYALALGVLALRQRHVTRHPAAS